MCVHVSMCTCTCVCVCFHPFPQTPFLPFFLSSLCGVGAGEYLLFEDFLQDIELIRDNALAYNPTTGEQGKTRGRRKGDGRIRVCVCVCV